MRNLAIVLVFFAAALLQSCQSSNTVNEPTDEIPWGYEWAIGREFYLSQFDVDDENKFSNVQINMVYYAHDIEGLKDQCLPNWWYDDNIPMTYVATHTEGDYIVDVYHTTSYALGWNVALKENYKVPLDCYCYIRLLKNETLPKAQRVVDIKVFHTLSDRESTEFTLLFDELRYVDNGIFFMNEK